MTYVSRADKLLCRFANMSSDTRLRFYLKQNTPEEEFQNKSNVYGTTQEGMVSIIRIGLHNIP
jgi:hypothetical protein